MATSLKVEILRNGDYESLAAVYDISSKDKVLIYENYEITNNTI